MSLTDTYDEVAPPPEDVVKYMKDTAKATKTEKLTDALDSYEADVAKLRASIPKAGSNINQAVLPFMMAAAGKGDILQAFIGLVMGANKGSEAVLEANREIDSILVKHRNLDELLRVHDPIAYKDRMDNKQPKATGSIFSFMK